MIFLDRMFDTEWNECFAHRASGRVPIVWVLLESLEHDCSQLAGHRTIGIGLAEIEGWVHEVAGDQRRDARPVDRIDAGEQLVQHDTEAVEVTDPADVSALVRLEVFGRGVSHLAEKCSGRGQALLALVVDLGDAEIDELDLERAFVVAGYQEVVR